MNGVLSSAKRSNLLMFQIKIDVNVNFKRQKIECFSRRWYTWMLFERNENEVEIIEF